MKATRRQFALGLGAGVANAAIVGRAQAQTIVLRSAEIHPDGYPTVDAVRFMSERLERRTSGRLRIQVFHSAQLGQERDTIDQTRFGVIDMNRINMAPFNNLVPETNVPALPFVFRSIEHMRRTMDGGIGDEMLRAFEPHGLVGLAFYDSGARSFYNGRRPINTPADMRGLKIRVQQSDMFVALVQALGANATPMPFGEVFSALQTGVIDGAENNWPSYESTRHFEVSRFYSLSEHSMSPEVLVMSKRRFDGLSAADREAVRETAKESVARMRELWDAREKQSEATVVARGTQVNRVQKQEFIAAMGPVIDRFANTPALKALVGRIQAVSA
jgi:tripartite ATP-independent transporter DctP family solute receptor